MYNIYIYIYVYIYIYICIKHNNKEASQEETSDFFKS